MPRKLKFLFKSAVVLSFVWAMFVLLYLQEVTVFGDGFLTACQQKGVSLPLEAPHIVVDVSDGTLTISDGDKLVRRYDISSGRSRSLGTLRKGVDSTPLGEYKVIRKAKREDMLFKGSRFLQIDFPSDEDVEKAWEQGLITSLEYERYYEVREETGKPPQDLSITKDIGIQGNYFTLMGSKSTNGSIALSNGDINDIFEHIPVGTPVIIRR